MATKSIIVLLLALTAFQGLQADTLLKRSVFGDFLNSTKNRIDEANQVLQNFTDHLEQQTKLEEHKIADRISKIKVYFKNIFDRNTTTEKRSPIWFTDIYNQIEQGISNLSSLANSSFGKRSPDFFSDIFGKFQQGISNLTSLANSSFGKLNLESKQKLEEFFKTFLQFSQNGDSQNTTVSSKRSISIDGGLAILNDLRSKLEAVVQNVTQYFSNANSTSFLDKIRNVTSDLVSNSFNLTEISVDVSECLKAEENNVTLELEQRETQLEAIYAKEKEAAQPFLQNVSVTTPKIAKLVIAASLNASSCGQNYICLAIVAYNVYNQAVVLEPEVTHEIQAGWALAQSLAADAKVVEQQIFAPAFSNMGAIGEETISCIEGKLDA